MRCYAGTSSPQAENKALNNEPQPNAAKAKTYEKQIAWVTLGSVRHDSSADVSSYRNRAQNTYLSRSNPTLQGDQTERSSQHHGMERQACTTPDVLPRGRQIQVKAVQQQGSPELACPSWSSPKPEALPSPPTCLLSRAVRCK